MRLVPTTRCPVIDAQLATSSDVVMFASDTLLVLLKYSPPFGAWYVCGFRSVNVCMRGDSVPDACYYWRNVGYVEEPCVGYALLQNPPARSAKEWTGLYENIIQLINGQQPSLG